MPQSGASRFKADLSALRKKSIDRVDNIRNGDSDGEVTFRYTHEALESPVTIKVLAQPLSAYPHEARFLLFSDDAEKVPHYITDALNEQEEFSYGSKLVETLIDVSKALTKAVAGANSSDRPPSENEDKDDSSDNDCYDEDYDFFEDNGNSFGKTERGGSAATSGLTLSPQAVARLQRDLRLVKESGYRVARIVGLEEEVPGGIISISIRINNLGIPDEALQAWGLADSEYVVLLIRFSKTYRSFEQLCNLGASLEREVSFRLGKCSTYKPCVGSSMAAFAENVGRNHFIPKTDKAAFSRIFISNSMDHSMEKEMFDMIKMRLTHKISWDNANLVLELRSRHGPAAKIPPNLLEVDTGLETNYLLGSDSEISFPLATMQFLMHYLANCTDYCLVCHRKVEGEVETIKPYVCSQALCLYQYMNLGFGPNVDHEVLSQPYVVDLLVCFCLSALQRPDRIRELPIGLGLRVPNIRQCYDMSKGIPLGTVQMDELKAKLKSSAPYNTLRPGTWVTITQKYTSAILLWDARVCAVDELDIEFDRLVPVSGLPPSAYHVDISGEAPRLDGTIAPEQFSNAMFQTQASGSDWRLQLYDANLDELEDVPKSLAMRYLVEALPSVAEMRSHLAAHPGNTLSKSKVLSPASFTILRWIVSSNRSCIFQVDRCPGQPGEIPESEADLSERLKRRIVGMSGWTQFRFAQGAPDKERRFNTALDESLARYQKHPTLFAWHGSPLFNWHSILRVGLDYQTTLHGRAYGNGVYLSQNVTVSKGYTGVAINSWSRSLLRPTTVLSLSEIVNKPLEFVSVTPHLVINKPDWIQCRYLFVQCNAPGEAQAGVTLSGTSSSENASTSYIEQDPQFEVQGLGHKLLIPVAASPSAMAGLAREDASVTAAEDVAATTALTATADGEEGEQEDDDDLLFLGLLEEGRSAKKIRTREPTEEALEEATFAPHHPLTPGEEADRAPNSQTNFVAGSLDLQTIRLLPAPAYATDVGTRTLAREVSQLQKAQFSAPLHELGWYVDWESLSNMFQWIVELHSFDPSLPLAQDMLANGITSIVLEVRFGRQYPLTPPFVRVVRPRFHPFALGGGGHVTAGGAMCMELLTGSGWSPANSMESVLLQVRMAMCNLEPKPARLSVAVERAGGVSALARSDYSVSEARDAFLRAAAAHGWAVPADMAEMTSADNWT